jgi:hypothetical protein
MKKSRQVPLLVIGTVSLLAGCSRFADDPMELTQNAYASREDCRREWGNDDRNCQPSGHGGGYVGPRYYWDRTTGYPYAVDSNGQTRVLSNSTLSRGTPAGATNITRTSVSRGGFGSTAHGFSMGG